MRTHIGNRNPIRYRGYYYDGAAELGGTGLYYLVSRYYDPEVGRFINADAIEYLDPETLNGLNLFAYCGNNPVMRTDASGNAWWDWLFAVFVFVFLVVGAIFTGGILGAAFAGAAIGAGLSLATQGINSALTGADFSWGQFFLDIGVGMVTGAIGASGISRLGSFFVGIAIGGLSDIGSQLISGKSFGEINWLSVGVSAVVGGLAGLAGGAGAKNKVKMNEHIIGNAAVKQAQNSVVKVGDKIAKGLYTTAQGAKSAYTQVMNRMSNAIFKAASTYSMKALATALGFYYISTLFRFGLSFISGL